MGIHYIIANLDKREYINPHDLGTGAKDGELNGRAGPALLLFLRDRWLGDRVGVYSDAGDDCYLIEKAGGFYDHRTGEVLPTFKNVSAEALEKFGQRYLTWNDPRLLKHAPAGGGIRGPWFRLYDPDEESTVGIEGWMKGWLAYHDPEAAARDRALEEGRLVAWLRDQGNRYEGLSARETLAAVISDIEEKAHLARAEPGPDGT